MANWPLSSDSKRQKAPFPETGFGANIHWFMHHIALANMESKDDTPINWFWLFDCVSNVRKLHFWAVFIATWPCFVNCPPSWIFKYISQNDRTFISLSDQNMKHFRAKFKEIYTVSRFSGDCFELRWWQQCQGNFFSAIPFRLKLWQELCWCLLKEVIAMFFNFWILFLCLIRSEPPSRKRKQQKQEGRQKRAAKLRKVSVDTDDVSSTDSFCSSPTTTNPRKHRIVCLGMVDGSSSFWGLSSVAHHSFWSVFCFHIMAICERLVRIAIAQSHHVCWLWRQQEV